MITAAKDEEVVMKLPVSISLRLFGILEARASGPLAVVLTFVLSALCIAAWLLTWHSL